MRNFIGLATAAVLALGMTSASNAMGLLPLAQQSAPEITLVSGGCGPYAHRGPFGGCQPGGQWGARGCPPGYHLGPYGQRCWINRRF